METEVQIYGEPGRLVITATFMLDRDRSATAIPIEMEFVQIEMESIHGTVAIPTFHISDKSAADVRNYIDTLVVTEAMRPELKGQIVRRTRDTDTP